jgi:hypothetical protein
MTRKGFLRSEHERATAIQCDVFDRFIADIFS